MIRVTIDLPDGDPAAVEHVGRLTVDALAIGARVCTLRLDPVGRVYEPGPNIAAAVVASPEPTEDPPDITAKTPRWRRVIPPDPTGEARIGEPGS